jgi:hypothetical protein
MVAIEYTYRIVPRYQSILSMLATRIRITSVFSEPRLQVNLSPCNGGRCRNWPNTGGKQTDLTA